MRQQYELFRKKHHDSVFADKSLSWRDKELFFEKELGIRKLLTFDDVSNIRKMRNLCHVDFVREMYKSRIDRINDYIIV